MGNLIINYCFLHIEMLAMTKFKKHLLQLLICSFCGNFARVITKRQIMTDIHDNRKLTCISCQICSYFKTETPSPTAIKSVGGFLWLRLKISHLHLVLFMVTLSMLTLTLDIIEKQGLFYVVCSEPTNRILMFIATSSEQKWDLFYS